jgi:hypothetical protein
MKKLILIVIGIVMMTTMSFSQSPIDVGRVATATTDFSVNIPVGKLIYCVATEKYYYCKTATASGSDLTDAAANFVEIGSATEADPVWISDSATYAAKSWVNDQGFLTTESDPVWISDSATYTAKSEVPDYEEDPVWISDSATYLSKSVAAETYQLVSDTSDNDATRYWVVSQGYVDTEADPVWISDSATYAAKSWVNDQGFLTSEVDGSITNEGLLTVGAGAANTSTINSNTSGSNAVTISGTSQIAVTENTGTHTITVGATTGIANTNLAVVDDADAADNDFAKFTDSGIEGRSYAEVRSDLGVGIPITEKFEEDDGTPTAHTLAQTPIGGEANCLVLLNGVPLTTDQFVLSGTTLTMGITVYAYDRVTITYYYSN